MISTAWSQTHTHTHSLTVKIRSALQWSSGKGCVLMFRIISMGWELRQLNHDSVNSNRSSVCCSTYTNHISFHLTAKNPPSEHKSCEKTHWNTLTGNVSRWARASKHLTLSSVAPSATTLLILFSTDVNFSPVTDSWVRKSSKMKSSIPVTSRDSVWLDSDSQAIHLIQYWFWWSLIQLWFIWEYFSFNVPFAYIQK